MYEYIKEFDILKSVGLNAFVASNGFWALIKNVVWDKSKEA